MSKTNVTLTAQTILQLDAGTHEAIRDGGDLYILFQREEGFDALPEALVSKGKEVPSGKPVKNAPLSRSKAEKEVESSDESIDWSEDEMSSMSSDDLLEKVEALGIDPDATKGRNTNKKLRNLILDYWEGDPQVADDEREEKEPVKGKSKTKSKSKAEPESEEGENIEIPFEEWEKLKEGDIVLAQLEMEGEDGDRLWEAEVVGWKKPRGGKEKKLYVYFTEDEQEDYLRENDRLFEYQEEL